MSIFLLILLLLACLWTLGSYLVMRNVSQPQYTVVETRSGYEIREYAPMIVAEVEVSASRGEAMNQGFRLLADYIFGNNTAKKSVAMTAPVMDSTSEKIAMTTPVMDTVSDKIAMTTPVIETMAEGGTRTVTFTMPSQYTLETLPTPNNPQVLLKQIPAKKMAVMRFSWWAGAGRFEHKAQILAEALRRDGVQTIGTPIFASYNPPLSAPWTRRNEVMIKIIAPAAM